jgi:hypothetical protein
MASTIVTKHRTADATAPTVSDIIQGELAINFADEVLYSRDESGNIVQLGVKKGTSSNSLVRWDGTNWVEVTSVTIDGSGNMGVGGTLGVTGATTLSSTLGVTGATTLSNDLTINKTGNGFFSINGTDAAFIRLQDSGGSTNQKYVDFVTDNGSFDIRLLNDDTSVKSIPIAIAPTGGIGVAGDVTVTGGALSVSHNNSATVPADVFGGMMTFNHTAGGGEVDFFNQYTSAGTGGFDFYQVTAGGSAANLLARLDKSGNATFAGNLGTSEGQITASNGDPLENVAVFTATNASYTGGALQVITTRAADATAFDLAKFNTSGGSTTNCRIRGDGDLENVNNAYTGISDIKLKQDIFLAGSQTEDIKAIAKIVSKYRLKDQVAHDENAHFHLGVIAQELELISAGLVGESEDSDYVEVSPAKAEVKELQPMTWQKPVMEIVQVVVLDEEGNPTDETETKEQQVHLDEETDVAESIVDGVLIAAHKAIVSKPQFTIENVVDSNGEIVMREVITQKAEPAKMDFVKNGEFTKHVKYSILYMKCVKALGELIERVEALEAK